MKEIELYKSYIAKKCYVQLYISIVGKLIKLDKCT